jgi:HEAT repeat protein
MAASVPLSMPHALPTPVPLAHSVSSIPFGAPVPASQRRRLTRLVLDLPDTVMRNVPRPLQGITGLAAVGLIAGLTAWGLTALAKLEVVGLAIASLGLLFGGVATVALLKREGKGLGLPLAALAVNLQALIVAVVAAVAAPPAEADNPAPRPQPANTAIQQLRQSLKDPDQKERLHAAFAVGELARDLSKTVLELMALLHDGQRNVRAAAAESLGLIGPQARIAYAILADVNRSDNDEIVRNKSKEAMKKIGPPTGSDVAAMMEVFADKKAPKQMRGAAALTLALIGNDARATVPALEEALNESDPAVRVSAAQALWVLVGRQAEGLTAVLIAGLKDFDPTVRAQAAQALIAMRGEAKDAAGALEVALGDADTLVRLRAAVALGNIGPAAKAQVPKLVDTLRDKDYKVRIYAALALWVIARQREGVPILCDALKTQDPLLRQMAAKGLHTICKEAKASQMPFVEKDAKAGKVSIASAVPTLIDALKDNDKDVRGLAALTVGVIGKDAQEAVQPLMAALKHSDPNFRVEVAFALSGIGEAAKPAIPVLKDALHGDRDNNVKVYAAQALWVIERRADDIVPTLIKVLEDRDGQVRARAAFALGMLRGEAKAAVPQLNDALKDGNPSLRLAAATALGKIGPPARVAYPTLDHLTKDDHAEIKKAASTAMKEIGRPQKTDVQTLLIPALKNDNPQYRMAATVCLWMLYREAREAVGPLSELLTDPDENVRGTAAFALGAIGTEAAPAVPALIKALKHQTDETLRYRAAYALGEIGPAAKKAVPALQLALDDKKPAVRFHAAQALWTIDKQALEVVPTLTKLLEEKELDAAFLAEAIVTLTEIGTKSSSDAKLADMLRTKTVPALARILGDGDQVLQLTAIGALGSIGVQGREAVPRLIEMLAESDAEIRLACIEALVKIGTAEKEAKVGIRAKTAFAALEFAYKIDRNAQVRNAANLAMLKLGRPGAADVPELASLAGDKNQTLPFRVAAAQVLGLIGPEAKPHVELVSKLLTTDDPNVRALTAAALADLGPDGKAAIAPLLQALKDEDAYVRVAVVQALGDIGQFFPPMVEPALRAVFLNAQELDAVREAAAKALQKITLPAK